MALNVNGVSAQRMIHGTNGKIAVIGRSMGDFARRGNYGVVDFARKLRSMGHETELFAGGRLSVAAREEIAALAKVHGGRVPDALIPKTRAYLENVEWARGLKRDGYTLIDVGNPNGFVEPSPFYNVEKHILFGDELP